MANDILSSATRNILSVLTTAAETAVEAVIPTNTARIEITNQNSPPPCGDNSATIARQIPTILHAQISQFRWDEFCNAIDVSIKFMGPLKRAQARVQLATWLVLVVYIVTLLLNFAILGNYKFYRTKTYYAFLCLFSVVLSGHLIMQVSPGKRMRRC